VVAGWTSVRPLIVSVDSWIESHVKQIASKGGSQVAKHDDVMFAAELSRQVVVRPMATLRENVKKTKANSKSKKTPKKRRAASRKKR
jgi:hypothetical protein